MSSKQVEFSVKFRDGLASASEAVNEYIPSFASKETQVAVMETTFKALKFEPQQGAKFGNYEVAHKTSNLPQKWSPAFNILNVNNATIQACYQDRDYEFSYCLYGTEKIYRQKLRRS